MSRGGKKPRRKRMQKKCVSYRKELPRRVSILLKDLSHDGEGEVEELDAIAGIFKIGMSRANYDAFPPGSEVSLGSYDLITM